MNYVIKDAIGGRYVVDLSKSGNKYNVGVWDKREHRTAEPFVTLDSYDTAEVIFKATCKRYNVEKYIKDVEHDLSDFNFD